MQSYDSTPEVTDSHFMPPLLQLNEGEQNYLVRHIPWDDTLRQDQYQQLRAEIFVKSLGWQIPVDEKGREWDHYDTEGYPTVKAYGVYGQDGQTEHFLGGVRLFALQNWNESMITNEFHSAGMIPDSAIRFLSALDCHDFMEITRLCVRRGRWYSPLVNNSNAFNCAVGRDLTYAAVYALANETRRTKAVGIADANYLQVMRRSHFSFTEVSVAKGVSLVIIDLWKTIYSIDRSGDMARAKRMLALCDSQR